MTENVQLTREPDDKPKVIVTAAAYRTPDDPHPAIGTSWMYLPGKTSYTVGSEIENVETSAWGRAIGALGILIDRSIASVNEVQSKAEPVRTEVYGTANPSPARPTAAENGTSYPAGDWQAHGIAAAGKAPYDAELRESPDGGVFGFRIETAEKKGYAVLCEGPMALPVSLVWESLKGAEVRVSGPTELVPWSKDGVDGKKHRMPPYRLIRAERIEGPDIVIPATDADIAARLEREDEAQAEAFTEVMSLLGVDEEAELDAIAEGL